MLIRPDSEAAVSVVFATVEGASVDSEVTSGADCGTTNKTA